MNAKINLSKNVKRRRVIQWLVWPMVVVVIGLGWRWPMLGFIVPAVMMMGFIGGFFNGRFVCGNLCPRGAFLDRIVAPISRRKPVPKFLRNKNFRWIIFAALMGFMVFRVLANPGSWEHWGRVFWMMCVITTGIGLVGGLLVHPRFWCSFCPIGTAQNAVGGGKHQLVIDPTCKECGLCEKACPMNLEIMKHKPAGKLADRDCLKCNECTNACPINAIHKAENNS